METTREFHPADRYLYDFGICSIKNGFAQVDTSQDASYFGTWADPIRLIIFSYLEGDCITQTFQRQEDFAREIRNIKRFNNENGFRFIGIDPGFNETLKVAFVNIGLRDLLH